MSNEVVVLNEETKVAVKGATFQDRLRDCYPLATKICNEDIIPTAYKGNPMKIAVAIEMANRMDAPLTFVMNNLYQIKGKNSWSGQACIMMIRNHYEDMEYHYFGEEGTSERGCYVSAKRNGKELNGTKVTIAMANAEGWTSNSKWKNMPEQMLAYRAATFFLRMYSPELLEGFTTEGEQEDISRKVKDVL